MARELQLAQRAGHQECVPRLAEYTESMIPQGSSASQDPSQILSLCDHRKVSKDGRIVCAQIVEGDNEVSPNVCRDCPFKAVNCSHLRFSLRQTVPSRLIVRYNGRTEIWDDDPPELHFERAACTTKVTPVYEPRSCAGCALRQPVQAPIERPKRRRQVIGTGGSVSFPSHEQLAATG